MLQVSLFIELLRAQPVTIFWIATLAQAALWWLFPILFYLGPPGDLAETLAIGHEFQLGSYLGPPLAFWVADIAFRVLGSAGVYLLSQICVVVTYWAVFALGRSIVGVHHAALAVLMMVGVSIFTVPSPDFGPTSLAMMLTALALLHFWRALGEGKRIYWFVVALELGLLMLTSVFGLILAGLLALFMGLTDRGHAALGSIEPWVAGLVVVVMLFPYLIWLDSVGDVITPIIARMHSAQAGDTNLTLWARLLVGLLLTHFGLALLVVLASGWKARASKDVPVFERKPLDPLARRFVYFFALAPGLVSTLIAVLIGQQSPVGGAAPVVVLSGLAVVVASGEAINLHRQRMLGFAWLALLIVPAIMTVGAIVVLPWIAGVDLKIAQPADAIGRFFSESFQRRTGQPLAIVAGDARMAELVAYGSASRPSVYFATEPERSPWITAEDIQRKGAVVVWPTTDTAGTPPPDIRARFPDLVPEVPRAFERLVQGRLSLQRVGWGMIRPAASGPSPPP
jgi:4-amino-4-deoxy-L-arabinose transferase-like glycosyltransferase